MSIIACFCPISPLRNRESGSRVSTHDACVEQDWCSVCNAVDWQRCLLSLYPGFPSMDDTASFGLLSSLQAMSGWPMKKWKTLQLQQKRLVFVEPKQKCLYIEKRKNRNWYTINQRNEVCYIVTHRDNWCFDYIFTLVYLFDNWKWNS